MWECPFFQGSAVPKTTYNRDASFIVTCSTMSSHFVYDIPVVAATLVAILRLLYLLLLTLLPQLASCSRKCPDPYSSTPTTEVYNSRSHLAEMSRSLLHSLTTSIWRERRANDTHLSSSHLSVNHRPISARGRQRRHTTLPVSGDRPKKRRR